jgi:hypothetical protein
LPRVVEAGAFDDGAGESLPVLLPQAETIAAVAASKKTRSR